MGDIEDNSNHRTFCRETKWKHFLFQKTIRTVQFIKHQHINLRLVKKLTEARGEVVAQNDSAVFIVQLSILRIDFYSKIRLPHLGRPFEELHKFKPPI